MPSEIERRAGIEKFAQFSFYNTVNTLAGGDVLKWRDVMNLPWHVAYLKMHMNKTEQAYGKKIKELMEK